MRKTKKTLAILALVAMVLTMIPLQVFAATTSATDATRLGGADRIATANLIADAGFPNGASTVIVAPADDANLVDALAAAPLAGTTSPILLAYKDGSSNASVQAEITKLGAKNVYLVGAAASDAIANGLSGVTITKLAGADRIATAALINAKLSSPAGTFVVGYNGTPDALSVASYAAANNYAIVLTNPDGSVDTSKLVGSKTYLVGGTGVVQDYSGATDRFGGSDRFLTNKAVVDGLDYTYGKVYVANGNSLVDALAAAPLAAQAKAPILLTDGSSVAAASDVNAKLTADSTVVALGGVGAVPDAAKGLVTYTAPVQSALAVSSVTALNLNQIQVVFSQAVDSDSAEKVSNYAIDGTALTDGTGGTDTNIATLQSDDKTVIITLGTPYAQYKTVTFTVKKAIFTKDMLSTVPSKDTSITFSDVTVPTVKSVTVSGNTKLDVQFSEAVQLTQADVAAWQINGQSLSNFAYDGAAVLDDNAKGVAGGTSYTDEVELYFNAKLPVGDNTLTVPAGSATILHDAAGFLIAKTATTFTVLSVTDNPTISSVTGDDTGTIYVTFNRAMDKTTALTAGNYSINGVANVAVPTFKSGTGSTVVKIAAGSAAVHTGANVLFVSKNVKDSYGNKLADDQNVAFTVAEDDTAPTVNSVTLLDKNTIRIQFSEDVNAAYAVNTGNYKLVDSTGTDITSDINKIQDPSGSQVANGDTWDIKFLDANALTGSNYTLTIKNIVDLAATPNAMADYTTTFSGNDTVAPSITMVTNSSSSTHKVVVFFSEAMDNASIMNAANYAYTDGGNNVKALPGSATLTAGDGNKSVVIAFPSNYTVVTAPTALDTNTSHVFKIRVANVTDAAGNVLDVIAATNTITAIGNVANNLKPQMSDDSFDLAYSGSTVQATIQYNQAINTLNIADWQVGSAANGWVAADSGYISGKSVVLNFTTSGTINVIKAAGTAAQIKTVAANSLNVAGVPILNDGTQVQTVYDYSLQPKIVDALSGEIGTASAATTSASITFDEPIDSTITGNYADDFTFIDQTKGTVLTVQSVAVNTGGNSRIVTFTFKQAIANGDKLSVRAIAANISIRSQKDQDSNYAVYVPSSDDTSVNTITVGP